MMNEIIKNIADIDMVLASGKGLYVNDDLSDKYYVLYRNYKILLEKYFLNKLPLKEYDDVISNSGLLFKTVDKDDMDMYQLLSTLNLKYIYLRNNLFVEKLSLDDIDKLIKLSDKDMSKPNDELFKLIDRTYKEIIDSKPMDEENSYMTRYGPDNDRFWFDSSELVFGIRYDDFAANELGEEEEWQDNYFKQVNLLNKVMKELSLKCSEILGIKVNMIHYDEFNVINTMGR